MMCIMMQFETENLKFIKMRIILNYKKIYILGIFCCVMMLSTTAQSELVDKIVANVGDEIILLSDVEAEYIRFINQNEQFVEESYKCNILDQLMAQKLLLSQAQTDSIVVPQEELESELDRRMRFFVQQLGSEENLENYYGKTILELKDDFREQLEEVLLVQKMQAEITNSVTVSPAEVKSFFNQIPKDSLPYFNAEVEMAQIVLYPEINSEQKSITKAQLEEVRRKIVTGESDFCKMASAFSEDPGSAVNCGELGFVNRGELVPAFEAVAFKLAPDEISQVIESQFGFHIIQGIERQGERVNCRHILIKPTVVESDIAVVTKRLLDIKELILIDSLSFAEAAQKYSEDEQTKSSGGLMINQQTGGNGFEMDELDFSTFMVIDTIGQDAVSGVIEYTDLSGKQAVRLIKVEKTIEPHEANLALDYSRIQNVAISNKRNAAINDWIQDKISKQYIYINPGYEECEVLSKWKMVE